MNKLTKKSFYSFIALYLLSSLFFLALAAYWFFTSQVSMEMNNNFYKMTNIADNINTKIIKAEMNDVKYKLEQLPMATISSYDANKTLLDGNALHNINFEKSFYMKDNSFTLVSKNAAGHLGVEYVVVQSNQCNKNVAALKNRVAYTVIISAFLILIIAVVLSYIFLKPLKDKMKEIEEFVKDTTHELNTPITALMMSTSRLKKKQSYDEKINKNISISTKQLYDIYSSLSFLSFDKDTEKDEQLDFADVVNETLEYFQELLEKKNITLTSKIESTQLLIAPTKAKMLINNLISNSIKYSTPKTSINITLQNNTLVVKDEGIGIAKDKLKTIFERFTRANSYAGGFGVGLNIVDGIIKKYNYKINIQSTLGEGTMVSIKLIDNR